MSRENDGFEFHSTRLQRFLDAAYRIINVFVRWDRLPMLMAAINIAVFRDRLRARNNFTIPATASHRRTSGNLVTSAGDLPTVHTTALHIRAWEWRERGLRATFP